ncbi:uncharacterized protein TNCV_315441 [Trichonephila clavipes]|nr:uncharacterized protein TNCV_315441 [Trichonephila clavipes]
MCIVPSRHVGTLNTCRAASPLVRLVEEEERWEASEYTQVVLPLNCIPEPCRKVDCMVLKATNNDMRQLALSHDEFREPQPGLCRSGSVGNNTTG